MLSFAVNGETTPTCRKIGDEEKYVCKVRLIWPSRM